MSQYDRDYMREDPAFQRRSGSSFSCFHAVVFLTIAVFFVQFVLGEGWVRDPFLGDRPMGGVSVDDLSRGRYWALVTSLFVHGGILHLVMNMLILWFAGKPVQQIYGPVRFLQIYLVSGMLGAATELAVIAWTTDLRSVPLVGASAACFGLLMAFAVARPREPIDAVLYFVVPIPTRLGTVALILAGGNLILALLSLTDFLPAWLRGENGITAYFAHVGGAAAGWAFARSLSLKNSGALPFVPDASDAPIRRRRPQMARVTRRPVVQLDSEAGRDQTSTSNPLADLMRDEVDPILDKISEQGIHSLTDEERRTLDRASRRMRRGRNG